MGGILSTYTKMGRGGFVRGDFVLHSWSIPVVTLDTVAKNRLSWNACEKCQRVVSGKIKKATSNFILIE